MKKINLAQPVLTTAISLLTAMIASNVSATESEWPDRYTSVGVEGNYNIAAEGADDTNNDNLENYFQSAISIHRRFNPTYSLRLQYGVAEADTTNSDADADIERIQLGLRRHAAEKIDENWRPFAGAGFDYVEYTVDQTNVDVDESAIYGEVGLQRLLNPRILMEIGTRVRVEFEELFIDAQPFIGVQFLMGRQYPEVEPIVAEPEPIDSDADGVIDPMDQCPGTQADVLVDEKGCPQLLTETIQKSLYVEFDLNKTIVKQTSYAEIEEFATYLKQFVNSELILEGHTDSSGSDNYNMRLSEGRAVAVKRVLVEQYGIASERIQTVGMGETQPIADNSTSEGRAKNRRVEAILSGSKTEVLRK